jgi:hypothetical protein
MSSLIYSSATFVPTIFFPSNRPYNIYYVRISLATFAAITLCIHFRTCLLLTPAYTRGSNLKFTPKLWNISLSYRASAHSIDCSFKYSVSYFMQLDSPSQADAICFCYCRLLFPSPPGTTCPTLSNKYYGRRLVPRSC